ncbi:MAG: ABC transporter permease, partial [Marivivens sp.]|nr:ABC transporter permease [Marivivens sp.]
MNALVLKLLVQRISLGLVLIFFVSIMIFLGTQILPGDVAQAILGQSATPESLANLREELGLNIPAYQRYLSWLGGVLQGDLGTSLTNGRDIGQSIADRMGNTLFLAAWAAIISVPLAITLGLISVLYRGRWPDKLISAVTLSAISVPEFMMSYILMYYVAVQLGWAPSVAMLNDR